MLRGAIVCPDRELGDRLVSALLESHRIGIVRRLEAYPNAVDLGRFLRAAAPEILFLSIETRQQALETAKYVEELVPGVQVVAINRTCDPQILLETMRAGIREFLSPPFEHQALLDAGAKPVLLVFGEDGEHRRIELEARERVLARRSGGTQASEFVDQ